MFIRYIRSFTNSDTHMIVFRSVIEHIKKAHNILEGAVKYLKCRHSGCKFKTIKEEKLVQHCKEAGVGHG